MTKKIKIFNKKDNWDSYFFFKIYINKEDNKKHIHYIFHNSREFLSHSYMDWVSYHFSYKHDMLLDEFCEWDNYYARENLLGGGDYESIADKTIYDSPQEAFEETNKLLKRSKGEYWTRLDTKDIDEFIQPGFYFGY